MPIGDPISETIPAVSTAGTGYATQLVSFLTEVKNRLSAKVPITSILSGLLDMANNAIANLKYVGLYEQVASPTTPVGSLQRYGGNLWYVSPSGAFQITNGAALNATSLKGFTGDYGSPNPAEARFVDADQRYNFYDDFGTGAWGYVRARGFDVTGGATSANRVRVAWGGVADYTLTLPAAVPGSAALLQMATTGAVTANNTLAATITVTETKHTGTLGLIIPASAARETNGTHVALNSGTGSTQVGWTIALSANGIAYPICLPAGSRITGYRLYLSKGSDAANIPTARIYSTRCDSLGTETAQGAGSSSNANAPGFIQLSESGLSIDMALGREYYLVFRGGAAGALGAGVTVYSCEIDYTRP